MARNSVPSVLLVLLSSALAGCAASDDAGEGSASLYVKDKVTDEYREVHVVFQTATIHQAGGDDNEDEDAAGDEDETDDNDTDETEDADEAGDDDDDEAGGWRELVANRTSGIDVDLLNATGANAVFLGEAELPAGHYTQIRVHVQEAYAITMDGDRVELSVPSGIVRVVRSFEVEDGEETRIILDFDLERSIVCTGQGACHLRPVIGKTLVEVVADDESGEDTNEVGETAEVAEE